MSILHRTAINMWTTNVRETDTYYTYHRCHISHWTIWECNEHFWKGESNFEIFII